VCGIVGAVAARPAQSILVEGLKRLEYRGYDSAGLAQLSDGEIVCVRAQGKVAELEGQLSHSDAHVGIAHTRWATHGVPSVNNAHPHCSGRFAVVHNGIIENHADLKASLESAGFEFQSQTDTEVIAHRLAQVSLESDSFDETVNRVVDQLEGAFAIAIVDQMTPDAIWVARQGSPLVIGVGHSEHFVGSDQLALLHVTDRFIFLEEGDRARVTREHAQVYSAAGQPVDRPIIQANATSDMATKGAYRHFMAKEIHEQPTAIRDTLAGRIGQSTLLDGVLGPDGATVLDQTKAVQIVACGTSYHAGLVAKYWIEHLVRIPCQVEIASEYRYRDVVTVPGTLWVAISQSGETADVLAALRHIERTHVVATLGLCNVATSSLVRETDLALMTEAGPEIGVASTKAFTTQLTALLVLAGLLAKRQASAQFDEQNLVRHLRTLPNLVTDVLNQDAAIREIAERFVDKHHALFLGRSTAHPIAMEGALKLKELSYIHAEAYPAGELKHGPLALVDEDMPVVAVAPNDALVEKLRSNLSEVRARGGQLIVFSDSAVHATGDDTTYCRLPEIPELLAPIVFTVPLQLLSYHVAVLRGTDVDQPRNLAKSVTVE
jgi:glucosamine--fructose-6-phosphate aminotransferase (isomerizing)